MAVEHIVSTTDEFFHRLDEMQVKLQNFSGDVDARREKVFAELRQFAKESSQNVQHVDEKSSEIEKAVAASMTKVQQAIDEWQKKIEENHKGTEFMQKHEKYLVLMVFGAVKAGKSTLGNFFAGKELVDAPFDNAYKHHKAAEFSTEEERREKGGLTEKDAEGRQWFKEGILDTTGNIQYFTLSGLRWMDSPGTGAVSKSTDKLENNRSMDDMVREYIPYTDMCVFLMNSSEPGLMEDMQYIKLLSKENQTALIVITKSDIIDEDEDDDGEIIQTCIPKTKEVRQKQEEYICNQIHQQYPDIPADKYSAMSVSTYLAKEGIKQKDEDIYKGSQLDVLMQKIIEKAGDNVVALKEKKPKKNVNAFIDNIISSTDNKGSIAELKKSLTDIRKKIGESQSELEKKAGRIQRSVGHMVTAEAKKNLRRWASEVASSGGTLSDNEISRRLINLINPKLDKELNQAIGDVIQNYQEQSMAALEIAVNGGGIRKVQKTINTEYKVKENVFRDADGIIETVRSWFGKKFTKEVFKKQTITQTIDLGTNIDDYIDQIVPLLDEALSNNIAKNVERIKENYFKPQLAYAEQMNVKLDELVQHLQGMRFEVED